MHTNQRNLYESDSSTLLLRQPQDGRPHCYPVLLIDQNVIHRPDKIDVV